MKIIVYSHTSSFYGAPKSILELTEELLKRGNVISYILPEEGILKEELERRNYKVILLKNPIWACAPREKNYSRYNYFKHRIKLILNFLKEIINSYKRHIKFIKNEKPDLIFVNTSVSPLGLMIARKLRIKSVLFARETLINKDLYRIQALFPKFIIKKIIGFSDLTICPSDYLASYFKERFGLANVYRVYDPVDLLPVDKEKISDLACVFGLVGSLAERKGQLEFAEKFIQRSENGILKIFGDGNEIYRKKLLTISESHPKKIQLYQFEKDITKIYDSFDIYINMGVNESFGRTTVEAMRRGKLVFGRNSGATPEIIKHKINGFLFVNIDEIYDIISEYLCNGRIEKLTEIRKNGIESSLKYTRENAVDDFLSLMNKQF